MNISLRELMERSDGWGHEEGRQLHTKLLARVEENPADLVCSISLTGVERTDASFPRESVMELARRFRGHRGFCLTDVENQDLLENWDAAATKIGQPLCVWSGENARLIGPKPTEGTTELFDYILENPFVTTSMIVSKFNLSVQNASNKLNRLWSDGYVLRRERVSPSGGTEYQYFKIK